MTSTNISNLLTKQTTAVSSAVKTNAATSQVEKKEDAQEVFSNVMTQTQSGSKVEPGKNDTHMEVTKVGANNRDEQSNLTTRSDNKQIKKADDARDTSAIKDKLEDKTEQFAEDVKDVIEEELDVTEEEIEESMANLGLSMLDLTDPANLSKLVADLSNSVDQTELLMSDGFLNIMQQVETLTEQMMQDLGIDADQLKMLVNEMQQPAEDFSMEANVDQMSQIDTEEVQETRNVQDEVTTEELKSAQTAVDTTKVTETVATVQETQNVTEVQTDADELPSDSQNTDVNTSEQTEGEQAQTNSGETSADANDSDSQLADTTLTSHRHESTVQPENNHVGQFVQTMDAATQPVQTTPVNTTTQIDVESIMRQIAEFSKTVSNQAGTTLQMQLNPENLGKIYMQISTTREGNVTAQLAAQNEAVKEALESQVATLRENLNQQGVKVDAIEVTVSTHEFERNLEQNASSQEQQGEQQEARRHSGRRNLNLDSLDELSGLMSEEEVLAARIMQQNGNSMDVTA